MKRFFQQLINDLRSSGANTPADPSGRHTLEMAASVILLETAASDEDLSHDELSEITEILRDHFHLTAQEAEEILATAETIRKDAIDLHQFTQTINMLCSTEQKMKLMESIWQVIYADGRLDKHEDYLVHKLARLLHIDHKDFIAAKLKARNEAGQ
jgi:uncharacterized tellurite resistance protein B-like protein